jgi:hypothetical protein
MPHIRRHYTSERPSPSTPSATAEDQHRAP